MTLESIEKLRRCVSENVPGVRGLVCGIADEIEAEIAERYMELPLDADGVPIHVGDEMMQNGKEIGTVIAVGYHGEPKAWILPHKCFISISYFASGIAHVKPRTLFDVLAEVENGELSIKDAEAEIRKLLGVEK